MNAIEKIKNILYNININLQISQICYSVRKQKSIKRRVILQVLVTKNNQK